MHVCVSHEQRVKLITVVPTQLLNLMTGPLHLLSSRHLFDEFRILKNTSQDVISDKLASPVCRTWIEC